MFYFCWPRRRRARKLIAPLPSQGIVLLLNPQRRLPGWLFLWPVKLWLPHPPPPPSQHTLTHFQQVGWPYNNPSLQLCNHYQMPFFSWTWDHVLTVWYRHKVLTQVSISGRETQSAFSVVRFCSFVLLSYKFLWHILSLSYMGVIPGTVAWLSSKQKCPWLRCDPLFMVS